jgi:16S rRNA (uracil1498-N3)-methyltransferase
MPPRLFVDASLRPGEPMALPPSAARHVQVLRLQPGDALTLFDGQGGQWSAEVAEIGRKVVLVRLHGHQAREVELPVQVTLALGMPANERMDTVVEKAAELGAAAIAPLITARSVLRVAGDRAERKAQHWQAIAQAACEQCGRNRVPAVAAPAALADWLAAPLPPDTQGLVLSLASDAPPLLDWLRTHRADRLVLLSGPEGGLTPQELSDAQKVGYAPVSLGPRVLRADTAPLAALACIAGLTP